MNTQEYQALEDFLHQLVQARAGTKDPQAEAMIRDATERQPDAAYLLVQRTLLLDRALSAAKQQIANLQAERDASRSGAGFLDSAKAWGSGVATAPASATPAAANGAAGASGPGFLGDGLRSALGRIATTAAGVAGGVFLYEGIEHLFHHNNGGNMFAQPAMGAMGAMPSDMTVVNNYFDGDASSAPLPSDTADSFFGDSTSWDDDSAVI